jgi:hypothetical protein
MLMYGVFEWNKDGSYPGHQAIKLYWREADAKRLATKLGAKGQRVVIREVTA